MALQNASLPITTDGGNDHTQQFLALNRKLRRQIYDLHNLFDILLELTTIHDRENLLYAVLVNLIGLSGTEGGAILLASENGDSFVPVKARGLPPNQIEQLTIPANHPLVLDLKQDNQPLFASVAGGDGSLLGKFASGFSDISLIAPISEHNNLHGITVLGPRIYTKPYTEHEIEVISLLDYFTAIVLSNVDLYERMERLSTTDPLTGLHNRRSFEQILQNEIARSKRFQMPFSLAMIDVDHFKNYNDVVGHQAGDTLLRELARVMRSTVRSTDYVARYGGEEFAIILPGVESQNALVLCERLRKKIEEHNFEHRHVQDGGKVTASFGAAYFPADAADANTLIAKADIALYTSKHRGRNQACAYRAGMEHETNATPSPELQQEAAAANLVTDEKSL